ncbi:MAG TPA: oxygen-independent coproporphyrinogen III oxidase [Clostridiales bacterium]|nr:oxygen-independent coproporphyrinogen III oxidase [Clostridiales bacterium]
MREGTIGLYVHFPFCLRKCLYCDFPSYAQKDHLMDEYLKAIKVEVDHAKAKINSRRIKTVFLGGGTPTLYHEGELAQLLDYIKHSCLISDDAEITIEANPETLNPRKLKVLMEAGINRLSIGMQAGQDRHLRALGRIHNIADVERGVDWARKAGFENINLDLMFGLPNQSVDEWLESLGCAVKMGVEHISAYALIIEEGTPLYELVEKGRLRIPPEDVERDMYHRGVQFLKSQGYIHYEISNFAIPGKECRHNLLYWQNKEYIGLGSGAHSYLQGHRWSNYADICKYIDRIYEYGNGIEQCEEISLSNQRFETIMMGLRLNSGVSKKIFRERFGHGLEYYYGDVLENLKAMGMLIETETSIYLTAKGMDLQNSVLLHFME